MQKSQDFLLLHFLVFMSSFIPTVGIWITLPATEIVFIRTIMAVLILGSVLYIKRISAWVSLKSLLLLLFSGIITAIYWILLIYSAKVANASVTLVGIATSPLWISFMSPIFSGKKFSFYQLVTGLNAVFGVYMIYSSNFTHSSGLTVAIAAAFFGALVTVLNGKLIQKHHHLVITFYQMVGAWTGTGLFLLFSTVVIAREIVIVPTWADLALILLLAAFFSVYAYSAFIKVMRSLSPFTVALATNLSPVYGIVIAIAIFGRQELMSIYFYSGAVIILASILAFPLAQFFFGNDRKNILASS